MAIVGAPGFEDRVTSRGNTGPKNGMVQCGGR